MAKDTSRTLRARRRGFVIATVAVIGIVGFGLGEWASPVLALLGGVLGVVQAMYTANWERVTGGSATRPAQDFVILYFGAFAFICLALSVLLGIFVGTPDFGAAAAS